jgi:hypothetical protein
MMDREEALQDVLEYFKQIRALLSAVESRLEEIQPQPPPKAEPYRPRRLIVDPMLGTL